MSVYVRDTAAAKSVRAILILKGARKVATVQVHYGNSGSCLVNIWQETESAARSAAAREKAGKPFKAVCYESPGAFQYARAGGYGYDKLTAALAGMNVDGHELTDHCGARLKMPKGLPLFPRDFKAHKGYSLANYCTISRATGGRIYRDEWMRRAADDLQIPESDHGEKWESIAARAAELESEWKAGPDCISGYSDCYRDSGLAYLKAIGYTVCDVL